jgi:hypothetical protein
MALPSCMSGDGRQAVFVGTMLQTGDAVALCDECLVMWTAALLQTMTGVDPGPFIAAMSETDPAGDVTAGAPSDGPPAPGPADKDPGADPPSNGRSSRGSRARGTAGGRGDQPGNGQGSYAPTDA